jgi:acetyl/propionyl-CoA carboxylase alpha subunit
MSHVEERYSQRQWTHVGEDPWETVNVGDRMSLLKPGAGRSGMAIVGRRKDYVQVWWKGRIIEFKVTSAEQRLRDQLRSHVHGEADALVSKMPGKVLSVKVKPGDKVEAGQTLLVIEAMKMENHMHVSHAVVVDQVHVSPQQVVEAGQLLVSFKAP